MTGLWQPAPPRLALSPHHTDIWLTSTRLAQRQVQAYQRLLTQNELARAQKFKSAEKREEYIVTRGLLRQVLAQVAGLSLAGIDFHPGAHGKPLLERARFGESVAFNVSHTQGLALVALAAHGRLGVDLERVRTEVAWPRLAQRYFSAAECRALRSHTGETARRAFFSCWTRKEAFVKALGAGVSYGLREFDVSVGPDEERVALSLRDQHEDAAGWLLKNIPAPAGYVAAVAIDRPATQFRFWRAPEPCSQ